MAKPRDSVKNKVILTFLLGIATILTAGIFGWFSVRQILTKVDELAYPQTSPGLINSIFTDLINLERAGRYVPANKSDSVIEAYQYSIEQLKGKLDTLKASVASNELSVHTIDSVSLLLDQLGHGYEELISAQKRFGLSSLSLKLMQEISAELSNGSLRQSDTSFVVKNNTSYRHVSEFTMRTIDSLNQIETDPERQNLFKKLKRLFSKKEDNKPLDTIYVVPDKQIDSLEVSSVDSVTVKKTDEFRRELTKLVTNFHEKENKSLENLTKLESNISKKNAALMETIESFLLLIDREEIYASQKSAAEAYQTSIGFRRALFAIIVFFMVAGLAMLALLLKDLRKSKFYEEQILREKDKSEKATQLKQQFLATMSHEIRSPLTSIVGYADLLQGSSEYAEAIKASSKHLLQTANEILDLAKIEEGNIEITPESVDLKKFFYDLRLSFAESVRQKGLRFDIEITGVQDVWVETDVHRLNQIFNNLLYNAVKFTEQGFVKLKATCHQIHPKTIHLAVNVIDSGIGIKQQDQGLIFENYRQVGSVAYKQKGTGLGLSIVKQLVSLLNGSISVKSQPGEGSSFTVAFDFKPAAKPAPVEVAVRSNQFLDGMRVMVVDDDPLIVNLFNIILKKYGALVTMASDPFEALSKQINEDFDLYIVDLQLPHMAGIDLARGFQRKSGTKLNILLTTANVFIGNDDENLIDGVVIKPFSEQTLIQAVIDATGISAKEFPSAVSSEATNFGPSESYDISLIRAFAMDDPDIIKDLVTQFHSETSDDLEKLKAFQNEKDNKSILRIFHKLSSRLAQFGIRQLAELATQLEADLINNALSEQQLSFFIAQSEQTNEVIRNDFDL